MINPQTDHEIRAHLRYKQRRIERKLVETLADLRFCPNDAALKDELVTLESMYKELIDERSP